QLMQAVGMTGGAHRVTLTQAGRVRSSELLGVDQYVGPVPVSLEDYVARVRSQSVRDIVAHEPDVQKAFKDMVLEAEVLSQLGTAVVSGRAISIYGPPGTGKTTVAECLSEIFRKEAIWIPYAIEVDGQVITVYDAHVHEPIEGAAPLNGDGRWV